MFKLLSLLVATFLLLIAATCNHEKELQDKKSNKSDISRANERAFQSRLREGYTDKTSYLRGEHATIYADALPGEKPVQIIRLFDVHGKEVDKVKADIVPQKKISETAYKDGFGYEPAFIYDTSKLASGVYTWEKKFPMVISDKEKGAEIVVVYPTNSLNAYNRKGGGSVYGRPRRTHLSFLRPPRDAVWIQNGLDNTSVQCLKQFRSIEDIKFTYISDMDLEDYSFLEKAKALIITGHSEYWTRTARVNFDRFVDNGGHVAMLSGNSVWVQIRYTEDRKGMYVFKKLRNRDPIDNPKLLAIHWYSKVLEYPITPSIGASFIYGGYSSRSKRGSFGGFKIVKPRSPLLKGAQLSKGEVLKVGGFEMDGLPYTGFKDSGEPIIDYQRLPFRRVELIGFESVNRSKRPEVADQAGTFSVLQKRDNSGIIVSGATMNWCEDHKHNDKSRIYRITRNILDGFLGRSKIFSDDTPCRDVEGKAIDCT